MAKYTGRCQAGDIFINTSTFQPAHCGVVVKHDMIIHATKKGIREDTVDNWTTEADVFRAAPDLSQAEKDKVTRIADEIKASAEYGVGRAALKSTFSTHTVGAGCLARLHKYRERLKTHQGVVKHVYCSELVILSYQLACIIGEGNGIDATSRLFIDLDAKHTWPSTLRRWLKNSPRFTSLGTKGGS